MIDAVLFAFLLDDIMLVEAFDRLPLPPRAPAFAAITVRPARPS